MSQLCPWNQSNLTVRLPLQIAILSVLVLALALFLAACGGDDEPAATTVPTPAPAAATSAPPPTEVPAAVPTESAATGTGTGVATATATPRPAPTTAPAGATAAPTAAPTATEEPAPRGGVLRVGAAGWANDQFNPFFAQSLGEYVGLWNVYDAIAWLEGSDIKLGLAESVTPNADASEWTIVLKDAWFHDGSPVTAQDVAYSLSSYANPQTAPFFAPFYGNLDAANIRVTDDRTLVVPLHSPQGDFLDRTLATISLISPVGSTGGEAAIGSGPFKLEAYETGKSIRMVRNDNYWAGPSPSLDELEVIFIGDATARLNALKGGEIELATQVTPAGARAESDNQDIELLTAGVANSTVHSFAANVTLPPFDNPDVVRALKLATDRQGLINTVLLGYGEVGNDVIGKGLPGYNDALPQVERDIDEARRLFESAGVTELSMLTGEVTPGATAAAELLVQYLAEAGVTLTLEELPADQYYADFMLLFTTPLQTAWWTNRPATTQAAMMTGSNGGMNLTGIAGEEYDALLMEVIAEVDVDRRRELGLKLQEYLYENDGQIVWGFQEDLNAAVPGLSGLVFSQQVPRFHLTTWDR